MCLGASRTQVLQLIGGRSVRIALYAICAAGVVLFLTPHAIYQSLYDTKMEEIFGIAGGAAIVVLLASAAGIIPARRAAATDPVEVVRAE